MAETFTEKIQQSDASIEEPALQFSDGELAPWWASPYPEAELTPEAEKTVVELCRQIAQRDVASQRFAVETAWQERLFYRGFQYLLPRKNGGWIIPPFATAYNRSGGKVPARFYGNEVNIYATYCDILTAALTRDIPTVRFEPQNPESDSDITAADAATRYARLYRHQNDLLSLTTDIANFLCTDGRCVIVTDHVLDAQRFGREEADDEPPAVPETETLQEHIVIYVVRHGDTQLNVDGKLRGRSEEGLNEKGEREIDRAAVYLKKKGITSIICSPVQRSIDSAQELSATLNVPVSADDQFASLDVGEFAEQDAKENRDDISEAFENPEEPIGGGESPDEFNDRVTNGITNLLSELVSGEGGLAAPIALVTHDSVITALFNYFQGGEGMPTNLTPPGGVAAVTQNPDGTYDMINVFPMMGPEPSTSRKRGSPLGREVSRAYGKLESKVPVALQTLDQMTWVRISEEYDLTFARAMFPKKADAIKPGGGAGSPEAEIDRIARINAKISLEASYVTGDSIVKDVTIHRIWMRPAHYMDDCVKKETRGELFDKCPDGMQVVMAGDTLCLVRNECMDDHITLLNAIPGSGQNRLSLCGKAVSLQKRVNNWCDILDAFFTRTIPQRYIPTEVFNVDAIREQSAGPGPYIPYSLGDLANFAGKTIKDVIQVEETPNHQPFLPEFIRFFINDLPQLLLHALPSLFGGESNVDPGQASGVAMGIQRDQALAVMGTPWHYMQMAMCSVFKQAVQLAARCRNGIVSGSDREGKKVRLEVSELKGNVLCFPEQDANFPESWNQKQARLQQFLVASVQNQVLQKMLSRVGNFRLIRDAFGAQGFKVPEADSYEKQLGEFEVLRKSGPMPNPQKVMLQEQIGQIQQAMQEQQQQGAIIPDEALQQLQEMSQQMESLPDVISTVPIKDTDDHASEAEACLDWINGPEGRKSDNGTKEEKAAFANVNTHFHEHKAQIQQPPPVSKPLSISAKLADLPADAAAAKLQQEGLQSSGPEVDTSRELQSERKRMEKVTPLSAKDTTGSPVGAINVQ